MKEMSLVCGLFSMIVLFIVGIDSHNSRKNVQVESEELKFHERSTNGIVMLDSENNKYFVDYYILESANVKIDENVEITVALNQKGEILAIQ